MHAKTKKYFKYLELVREDIREEFDLLGIPRTMARICDYGCGNIVLDHNLPPDIDLAYCKKVLVNLLGKEYKGTPSGEVGLQIGIKHIAQNLAPGGLLCAVEYDKNFRLGKYLEMSKLHILKKAQIKRREIRSRGRTNVVSSFSLYLCQRPRLR